MGVFIAVEGIDGSGKSTVSRMLADYLAARKKKVLLAKEPSNSFWGRLAKFLSGFTSADFLQRFFAKDRKAHLRNVIGPALQDGYVVVCDRYALSSVAYAKNDDKARLLNALFAKPDLTIVLDVPVEVALKRLKRKKSAFERREILERARKRYLGSKATIIDAKYSPEIVFEKVKERVERLL